ncbi:hypothetical protein [Sphingomonas sp.]|uniref:hypothetical protein n=1 Tax=Sphingomonas sp. TaxID=28214 RepID=UPI002DD67108|nr:hypothetical protein [Sphingomonas sp.]
MTEGFLLQNTHGYHGTAQWVEGSPVKSVWTGLKLGGRNKLTVQTWRCGRCGNLQNYAK